MGHSTLSTKPAKPCPDFPLFPHRTNRWCKKIKGKSHYFGSVTADPNGEAALQLWLDQKDDLLGGRAPRSRTGAVAIRDVCNGFLNFKRRQLESGDICQWTFNEYEATCARIVKVLGAGTEVDSLMPEDFGKLRLNIAKQWGPVRLGNEIGRVKTVFNYAVDPDADLLDRLPRYGKEFKKPSAKTLRIARAQRGERMFEPEELRAVIAAASVNLKAMCLLAANAGFGNEDCASLPINAVDLKRGWLNLFRGKTGVQRKCPLWPETVEAIRAAIKSRPEPKDPEARPEPKDLKDSELLFIRPHGLSYRGDQVNHPIASAMSELLRKLKIKRRGLSFYSIRHVFQTIGEEARDMAGVRAIMGHAPPQNDMDATYRERFSDERLTAITDHVRNWLFPVVVEGGQQP